MESLAIPATPQNPRLEKPKSKILLLLIAGLLSLAIAVGVGWKYIEGAYYTAESKTNVVEKPKFLALDPFTVNLQDAGEDQFLQIGITLKIANVAEAERLRQNMPDVRNRLLYILTSKHASDLTSIVGKEKLAHEILIEANRVLGLVASQNNNDEYGGNAAFNSNIADGLGTLHQKVFEAISVGPMPIEKGDNTSRGVTEVLFTSFIIQ